MPANKLKPKVPKKKKRQPAPAIVTTNRDPRNLITR